MIGKILKIGLENKKGAVCVPLFLYVVFCYINYSKNTVG